MTLDTRINYKKCPNCKKESFYETVNSWYCKDCNYEEDKDESEVMEDFIEYCMSNHDNSN